MQRPFDRVTRSVATAISAFSAQILDDEPWERFGTSSPARAISAFIEKKLEQIHKAAKSYVAAHMELRVLAPPCVNERHQDCGGNAAGCDCPCHGGPPTRAA